MKTMELIDLLSTGNDGKDANFPTGGAGARMASAMAVGLAGSALMLVVIYGVRSDVLELLQQPLFWLKVSFPLAMLQAAQVATDRLVRPSMRIELGSVAALLWPLAALWLAGAGWLALAPPSQRLDLLLGSTWEICSINIALLSLPTLVTMFWFIRTMAPTRLAAAGAVAGVVAGTQGILVYSLYCVEMAPPFWGVWYVLGIMAPAILGALLGPALLRW